MESEPMFTPRKIPSTRGSEKGRTCDAASRRTGNPTRNRLSYSGPTAVQQCKGVSPEQQGSRYWHGCSSCSGHPSWGQPRLASQTVQTMVYQFNIITARKYRLVYQFNTTTARKYRLVYQFDTTTARKYRPRSTSLTLSLPESTDYGLPV